MHESREWEPTRVAWHVAREHRMSIRSRVANLGGHEVQPLTGMSASSRMGMAMRTARAGFRQGSAQS